VNTAGRYQSAIKKIDAANAGDPHQKELLYSLRMSEWLEKLRPDASEALRLAARAQHIRRWEIPRSGYPMGRAGYLKWRTGLYDFHARKAAGILSQCGYDASTVARVESLIQKKDIKADPEMQLLEDVVCLVFLENYFADFSEKHEEEKVINILRKTWRKMSPAGQKAARGIPLQPQAEALLKKALET